MCGWWMLQWMVLGRAREGMEKEASRGFEPRSLDSESRVLTVTPRGHVVEFESQKMSMDIGICCLPILGHLRLPLFRCHISSASAPWAWWGERGLARI